MEKLKKYQVCSWWKYNPIMQKPTSLNPVQPWSWFYYYGPDPAAGCSYGQYHDQSTDGHIITEKMSVVYSPVDGKEMEFVCDIDKKEVEGLFKKSQANISKAISCQCGYLASYVGESSKNCFCTKCGQEVKEVKEIKNDSKEGDKAVASIKQIKLAKEQIQASLKKVKAAEEMIQDEAEVSVEEILKMLDDNADEEGNVSVTEIKEQIEDLIEVDEDEVEELPEEVEVDEVDEVDEVEELPETEPSEEGDEDEISVDEIVDIINNEDKAEGDMKDMYIPIDEVIDSKKASAEEEIIEVDESEVSEIVDEDEVEEIDESEVEELPEDEGAVSEELPEDEGTPVSEENPVPETKEDEFLDLNMVLSEKRKAFIARKKARAAKANAVEGKDEEIKAVKKDECDPAEPKDNKKPEMHACDNPAAKACEETMEEKVKAVKFEPVASFEALSSIAKSDIDMVLYNEASENPTWNITVAGLPAARIQLSNQDSPAEIKKVFCSEDYAKELIEHCGRIGFIGAMKIVKAEFWATTDTDEKRRTRYKAEASASLERDRREYLARFKSDYMNCLNVVAAGINKNYFPEVGNPLKDHLFTNMKVCGLPEATSISVIEKSFREASAQYFQSLFDKATEYMNVSPEARSEIAKAIAGTNAIERNGGEHELENAEPATLSERLVRASVTAQVSNFRVEDAVKIDTNEYKNQLKSVFRK